jgi:anti-sigma factor RsiW
MQCDRARELMTAALDGAGPAELEDHLASCPACLEEWREVRAVDCLLRGQGLIDPPQHFTESVLARLEAEMALRPGWQVASMTVATIVLGTVMVLTAAAALVSGGAGVLSALGTAVDVPSLARAVAVAARLAARGTSAGIATGVTYTVVAVFIAVMWFGALVVPRHATIVAVASPDSF